MSCSSDDCSSKSSSPICKRKNCCPKVCNTLNTGINPDGIAITPNGSQCYVCNSNNYGITGADSVSVFDLCNGVFKTTISDSSFVSPYTATVDKCGQKVYITNSGTPTLGVPGTVSVIDTKTNTVISQITGFDGPSGCALSKQYAYVNNYGGPSGVGSGNGRTVSVVNLSNYSIISTISVGLAPAALAIDNKCSKLYVINYTTGLPGAGQLVTVDTKTNTVIYTLSGFTGPFGIVLSKCGRYAYITNFGSNNFAPYGTTVSIVDLKNQQIIDNIFTGIQPSGIAINPKCCRLYVSNYNTLYAGSDFSDLTSGQGTVSILKLSKKGDRAKVIAPTICVGNSPSNLAVSPRGKNLYCSNYASNSVSKICI